MKISKQLATFVFAVLLLIPVLSHAAKDAKGSKDHPLFTRMPGTYIWTYEEIDFDRVSFRVNDKGPDALRNTPVEGHKYLIRYLTEPRKGTSMLNIIRNHATAIKKIGGEVVFEWNQGATLRLVKDGREVWVTVGCSAGGSGGCDGAQLTILEKEEFVQQITSNDMLDTLNKDGFIALDIHFETGKATIKPESQPIVDQISALMKANPKLGISVEGHTDNVGKAADNKALSEARAKEVMAAIIKQGVDAKRLKAAGYGQERPVADNRAEEGRAKNRRVELVKI